MPDNLFRSVLGALAKLRKAPISVVVSIRPHGTTRFPKKEFLWNFIFEYFSKTCWENSRFIETWKEERVHWMKTSIYLCTHLANLFLEREIFQTKFVEKIKTSILGQITFFRKSFLLWQNVGKHCTAGQATYENIIWLMLVILKATYTHSDYVILGQDGSVGIAPRYGLDGPGIESRWEAKFSARVPTSPGTHPAFYTMGNGSFLCTLPDRSWDPPNLLYNWYWVFPLHASRPVLGPTQPSIQRVLGLSRG